MKPRDEPSELLSRYRLTHPGPGHAADNWARVQARVAGDRRPAPRARPRLQWWTAGAALAIAAALLLLLRTLLVAFSVRPAEADGASQSVDRHLGDPTGGTAVRAGPPLHDAPITSDPATTPAEPGRDAGTVDAIPPRVSARTSTRPPVSPAPASDGVPGSDEVELIGRARRALARGDLEALGAALDDHAQRYPGGVLAEERLAYAVQLACRRGDRDRDDLRTSFTRRFPGSHHHRAIRESCGTNGD